MKTKTRLQKIREFTIATTKLQMFMLGHKMTYRDGDAFRSKEQALLNVKRGTGILNSKHRKSLARDYWMTNKGWDIVWDQNDPRYLKMGNHAERLGLVWGGRWKKRDVFHVEYKGRV